MSLRLLKYFGSLPPSERPPLCRSHYGQSMSVTIDDFEPTLAQQQFADECDINNIVERYRDHGIIEHLNNSAHEYMDTTQFPSDYHEAQNLVHEAQAAFMGLDARVRDFFGNDPGRFFIFSQDPANAAEMVRLGLAEPLADAASAAPPSSPSGGAAERGSASASPSVGDTPSASQRAEKGAS